MSLLDEFDAVAFHDRFLPARLADGNGALAAAEAARLGALAFVTPSGSWTYAASNGSVDVIEGVVAEARVVVEVDDHSFAGLACDVDTPIAQLYQQRVTVRHGNPLKYVSWEPALRAMFHGRPIYDSSHIDLRELDGVTPLDAQRSFAAGELDRDAAAFAHQLDVAGFTVVTDALLRVEIDALLVEAAELREEARPGDGSSWWGKDRDGREVVTRVLCGHTKPMLRSLYRHPVVQSVAAASGMELKGASDDDLDGITVLWKLPDMAEGLADLPWHRDCGMGGHATMCPSMVMSICLTDGGPEAGELRALPGSQHTSHPFIDGTASDAPRGVPISVTAGDLSFHNGDVMHVSLPPTSPDGPHRISVLLTFTPANAHHHDGGRHYNDALLANSDGQVVHLGHTLRT